MAGSDDRPAREPRGPSVSSAGRSRAAERQDRLAQALRENLARRKEQARARAGSGAEGGPSQDAPKPGCAG